MRVDAGRFHRLHHRRGDRGRSRRPQRLCHQSRPRQRRRVRDRSAKRHARAATVGADQRQRAALLQPSIRPSAFSMSPTRAAIRSLPTGSGATANCRRPPSGCASAARPASSSAAEHPHERQDLRFRDPVGACRRGARSRHRRAGPADLPDHGLRLRGRRPRRGAVQPADRGLHLFAADQPDQRRARDAAGHARRRPRLHGHVVGPCGAGAGAVPADDAGRRDRRLLAPLRRLAAADAQHLSEVRLEGEHRRCRPAGQFQACADGQDQGLLHREPRQSRRRVSATSRRSRASPRQPAFR